MNHRIQKCSRFVAVLAIAATSLCITARLSQAEVLELSLNLEYTNPASPGSGGTWQLAAKTDEMGLQSLNVLLEGIQFETAGDITLLAPSGVVNGVDEAGFLNPPAAANFPAGYTSITVFQAPLVFSGTATGEQSYFYGVGSIVDVGGEGGAPNYPDQQTDYPGTTSIGPEISSLTNLSNVPWGTGDFLDDEDWASAAILLSGSFAPGQVPGFFSTDSLSSEGRLFTSVPANSTGQGDITGNIEAITVIRSNFEPIDGDFNVDGVVNQHDYTLWRDALGETVPAGTSYDVDGSGMIDEGDYMIWKTNFGTGSPASATAGLGGTAVPEPQAWWLGVVSCLVLGVFRLHRPQY